MPREVIMPALGMAQETGRLVAWLKQAGDPVSADEPLMEVETDKSVMEVPAGADGILTEIRAEAGEDVPVGQVVALICLDGEAAEAAPAAARPALHSEPEPRAPREERGGAGEAGHATIAAAPPKAAVGDRVLASPKARRLALERGIDLHALVAAGVAQPFHVADLERVADRPAAPGAASATRTNFATATCDRSAFDGFLAAMSGRGAVVLEPHVLAAAFAAASLRPSHGNAPLAVAVEAGPALRRVVYADPDRTPPSRPRLVSEGTAPDLILRDLTWSRLTSVALAGDPAPALTLGADGGRFTLSLAFDAEMLTLENAVTLLTGMADRLENPMENLA